LIAPAARPRRFGILLSAGVLAGAATALFMTFWLIDYHLSGGRGGPLAQLLALDNDTLENTLGSLAQVIVAVLGIAITVVSIVVQLAATRYTSRIADMFFRDPTNLALLGFFVVACIDAVWVSLAVTRTFVPRITVIVTVAMVTASLLLLVPYFAHVFAFLDPQKVIERIGEQALQGAFGRRARHQPAEGQALCAANLEHLADVAVNAVSQKDKVIASHAVTELREVLTRYLAGKAELPPSWFQLGPRLRRDPDFLALAPASVTELEATRSWLEWKGLRHFRTVFGEALLHLPEMAHVVAIDTRYVGEAALAANDLAVTRTTVKFFNTYLRVAHNARDVRASYNVLHQYRQFAERLIDERQDGEVAEIGHHLRYYGQLAFTQGQGFVTETVAYDLSELCEWAFARKAPSHAELLRTFMEVDKEAETSADEKTLRGVRKAQIKLATFYLLRGAEDEARVIYQDMRHERPARLASIRNELLAISAKEFWEVTDRGVNFDYLDDARRAQLDRFFGWFQPPS
jgi:hypothetical protein